MRKMEANGEPPCDGEIAARVCAEPDVRATAVLEPPTSGGEPGPGSRPEANAVLQRLAELKSSLRQRTDACEAAWPHAELTDQTRKDFDAAMVLAKSDEEAVASAAFDARMAAHHADAVVKIELAAAVNSVIPLLLSSWAPPVEFAMRNPDAFEGAAAWETSEVTAAYRSLTDSWRHICAGDPYLVAVSDLFDEGYRPHPVVVAITTKFQRRGREVGAEIVSAFELQDAARAEFIQALNGAGPAIEAWVRTHRPDLAIAVPEYYVHEVASGIAGVVAEWRDRQPQPRKPRAPAPADVDEDLPF